MVEYALIDTTLISFTITQDTVNLNVQEIDSSFHSNVNTLRNFLVKNDQSLNAANSYHNAAFELYSLLILPVEIIGPACCE